MRAHAKWCSASCTMKGYRALNPGRQRAYWIKSVYGVTQEQFDKMLEEQGGRCGICGKIVDINPEIRTDQWNIDHCHRTQAFCGVLCNPCNIGIGQLGDDAMRICTALAYVVRTRGVAPGDIQELDRALDVIRGQLVPASKSCEAMRLLQN